MIISVGQLWHTNGILYRVTSTHGDDLSYPITMEEVARAPSVNQEIDAYVLGFPANTREERRALLQAPRLMAQELRWFEVRSRLGHAKLETCSVEEWLARVSS